MRRSWALSAASHQSIPFLLPNRSPLLSGVNVPVFRCESWLVSLVMTMPVTCPVTFPVTGVEIGKCVTSQSWLMRRHGMSAGVLWAKSSLLKKKEQHTEEGTLCSYSVKLEKHSVKVWCFEFLQPLCDCAEKGKTVSELLTQRPDVVELQHQSCGSLPSDFWWSSHSCLNILPLETKGCLTGMSDHGVHHLTFEMCPAF